MSRSTSQSSAGVGTTANGSRGLSSKTNPNPLPPSDIKLFVTNLRLLDLDLRPDWPNITTQTFSSKHADQKQRIGGVEWALFVLFEIWDPQETAQKLQPFFPPLEPLQSLNLRAALYRCLNELKKDGVLGRDAVLRKTMLDECKGDKFFEVLALFSNAVLKKVLAAREDDGYGTAIARKLATATTLPSAKQASLLPLSIAHKAALVNILKRKDEKRRKYMEFEQLLDTKAGEINQRIRQCKATPRSQKFLLHEKDAEAVKKQLKDNWIGDQRWLETILYGDGAQVEDAFLTMHFNEVWPMVEKGQRIEDAVPEMGYLENLQLRVQEQHARLQKWKTFQDNLQQEKPTRKSQGPKAPSAARQLNFDDHLDLQLQSSKPSDGKRFESAPLRPEYRDILAEMDAELLRVTQATYNRAKAPQLSRKSSSQSGSRSPVRRRKSRSDSIPSYPVPSVIEMPRNPAPSPKKEEKQVATVSLRPWRNDTVATPLDSEATLVGHPLSTLAPIPLVPEHIEPRREDDHDPMFPEPSDTLPSVPLSPPQQHSPSPPPSSYWPSEPPVMEPQAMNPDDALAEQIISSIGNATPSPVKKPPRLSLLERTRMSMAHNTTFAPIDESPAPGSPPLPELPAQPAVALDRRASLLERTRLSMAAMSQNPRPPQTKKDKRKSTARQSLFPVNQFDTPRSRKSIQAIEEANSGTTTPKEALFSDDIDYEHVFKSRPKIAQSPVFSPPQLDSENDGDGVEAPTAGGARGLGIGDYDHDYDDYDEGVTGVDLADVDAGDEDGFTQAWDNSPSRKAGGGLRGKGKLFS